MTTPLANIFSLLLLLCPIGCGMFTGIPAHGGGKRFAIEQELVAASAIAAAHHLDVSDLVGKKCSVNFVCIGDEGGGSLFSGRYGVEALPKAPPRLGPSASATPPSGGSGGGSPPSGSSPTPKGSVSGGSPSPSGSGSPASPAPPPTPPSASPGGAGGPPATPPPMPSVSTPVPSIRTSGLTKPPTHGGIPNSVYTHIDPKTGKALQNAIYDSNGKIIGHVDFKNHGTGALSGHVHSFPTPGDPSSGHGAGKPHIPNSQLPPGWDQLPPGVQPHTPIGS